MKKTIWRQYCGSAVLFLLGTLCALPATAQLNGLVKDEASGQPLPYANIQVLGKNAGASANEQGRFSLPGADSTTTLVISATGYETLEARAGSDCTLKLHKANIQLTEVVIDNNRKGTLFKTGTYKKSDIGLHFEANGIPWILVRYFPYDKAYAHTPFLKSVMIETRSEVKDATFVVKLYRKGKDGLPGEFLYGENIIGHAKKGKQNTVVDLYAYDILFPEDGFFIGIEFLRIAQNEYTMRYAVDGERGKHTATRYSPSVGVLPSDNGDNAIVFMKGDWEKMWRNEGTVFNKRYEGKYNLFAMELTLTD